MISLIFFIFQNDCLKYLIEIYENNNNKIKAHFVYITNKNINKKIIENKEILNEPNKGNEKFNKLLSKLNLFLHNQINKYLNFKIVLIKINYI